MISSRSHPSDQRHVIRELVSEIEALRTKRRQACIDRTHPEGKRFTQEELSDFACPSYKNLVQGLTARLPSREMVQQIATYLECTHHERNDLLLAAQYLPEQQELRPDRYQMMLDTVLKQLDTLPFPAHVGGWGMINRFNQHFLTLNGLPPETPLCPPCTILDANFDPRWMIRERLQAVAWQENARTSVALFQRLYTHFQREPWYRAQVEQARAWADFSSLWDTSSIEVPGAQSEVMYTVPVGTERKVIRLRGYMTVFGTPDPYLFFLLPADVAAYSIFADLGIPVLGNGWEQAKPGEDLECITFLEKECS